ncbi:MAG: hypothetical protein KAI66_21840, partial [Lentisphaeria bacterium]|nr:hypothetical protein [Lentisphaeria bacterium]
PAGTYLVTDTVTINCAVGGAVTGLTVFGDSCGGLRANPLRSGNFLGTALIWGGEAGGIMFDVIGSTGMTIKDLNLYGINPNKEDAARAGILIQMHSKKGYGSMINRFSSLTLGSADTGFRFGSEVNMCASDCLFEFITVRNLDTAFKVLHSQGVDFLFNFMFALSCKTVFQFEHGGNVQVNTAQCTGCDLVVDIRGGGRNTGTYLFSNVRLESGSGGRTNRHQLLRCYPKWRQANVKFINYDDCQWNWKSNQTPKRNTPLCDIGPGSAVVIESSIFNGPVAALNGMEDAPANLITRECSFGFITPEEAIMANSFGYVKLLNNFTDKMKPLPDLVKWPNLTSTIVTSPTFQGKPLEGYKPGSTGPGKDIAEK